MNQQEIDALFNANVRVINQMNVSAGGMVKSLIMELCRLGRQTYIRLKDATPGGHCVHYELVEGDSDWVRRVAGALGFESVTSDTLEVRHV